MPSAATSRKTVEYVIAADQMYKSNVLALLNRRGFCLVWAVAAARNPDFHMTGGKGRTVRMCVIYLDLNGNVEIQEA